MVKNKPYKLGDSFLLTEKIPTFRPSLQKQSYLRNELAKIDLEDKFNCVIHLFITLEIEPSVMSVFCNTFLYLIKFC